MSICLGCGQKMVDGQVFNGLLKCHWDCTEATREKLGAAADAIIQQRIDNRLVKDGLSPAHPLWKKLGGSL